LKGKLLERVSGMRTTLYRDAPQSRADLAAVGITF
jgi:hypothetical protein